MLINTQNDQTQFADLLEQYDYPAPKQGDILEGTILHVSDNELFLDVGAKRTALVPPTELSELDDNFTKQYAVGDAIQVYVTETPRGDGSLVVSVERILVEKDWDSAEKYVESEEIVQLKVVGYNKGGFLVEFGRIQGFVPNSKYPPLQKVRGSEAQAHKSKLMGQTIDLQLLTVDRKSERLVLTAEKAFEDKIKAEWDKLAIGDKVTGHVTSLKPYGAFVSVGMLTGLLHISNIAHRELKHPGDALKVGDQVEVLIDDIDASKERISFDRKSLLPNPYQQFAQKHKLGDLVQGLVQSTVDFGVFVELEGGVVGLVHISEMVIVSGSHPSEALSQGDHILLAILEIDVEQERIGLSQRKVDQDAQIKWMMEQTED